MPKTANKSVISTADRVEEYRLHDLQESRNEREQAEQTYLQCVQREADGKPGDRDAELLVVALDVLDLTVDDFRRDVQTVRQMRQLETTFQQKAELKHQQEESQRDRDELIKKAEREIKEAKRRVYEIDDQLQRCGQAFTQLEQLIERRPDLAGLAFPKGESTVAELSASYIPPSRDVPDEGPGFIPHAIPTGNAHPD